MSAAVVFAHVFEANYHGWCLKSTEAHHMIAQNCGASFYGPLTEALTGLFLCQNTSKLAGQGGMCSHIIHRQIITDIMTAWSCWKRCKGLSVPRQVFVPALFPSNLVKFVWEAEVFRGYAYIASWLIGWREGWGCRGYGVLLPNYENQWRFLRGGGGKMKKGI